MEIVIEEFGSYLGKKSERLVVRGRDKSERQVPLFDIREICICSRGVTISTDLLQECMERGIMVHLLDRGGRPYAQISSPALSGTILTRREQLLAFYDDRGVDFVRGTIRGKLRNQQNTLRYFAKYRKGRDGLVYEALSQASDAIASILDELGKLEGECVDDLRLKFLNLEGRAADRYWHAVSIMLEGTGVSFSGRERRGAIDPINSLLNYGYGILYSRVWAAVVRAGLDPFAGFLHVDRPGKPSLILDLVEEFRQPVVDRSILGMLGRGWRPGMDEDRLDSGSRRELAKKVCERLESRERYSGKKHRLASIIQMQARHLATALRGEHQYQPFVGGW